jgi:hypothetical protein
MRCSSSVWLRWRFSLRSNDAQRQGDPIGEMLDSLMVRVVHSPLLTAQQ